jgi:hypothetical protein
MERGAGPFLLGPGGSGYSAPCKASAIPVPIPPLPYPAGWIPPAWPQDKLRPIFHWLLPEPEML